MSSCSEIVPKADEVAKAVRLPLFDESRGRTGVGTWPSV